jgi:hypothetical protein
MVELAAGIALDIGALVDIVLVAETIVLLVSVVLVAAGGLQATRLAAANTASEARAKVRTCVMMGFSRFERKE